MITVVTATDVVVELRPPRIAQVLFAASLVVAAAMVVFFVRDIAGEGPFTFLFPVVLIGIVAFNAATALSWARGDAAGYLTVRNRFTTRRLHRSDVDRVLTGRQAGSGSPRRLELLLMDGDTLQLVATEVPPLPGLRARLDRQAEELRAWVADRPAPYLT